MAMTTFSPEDHDEFFQHFAVGLLWSSASEDDDNITDDHGIKDLAPITSQALKEACRVFLDEHGADVQQATQTIGYDLARAGHDLALSCNGHGAGFFDRGLDDVGDRLQRAAEAFGQKEAYVGDDGLVYVAGMETEPEPEATSPRRPKL